MLFGFLHRVTIAIIDLKETIIFMVLCSCQICKENYADLLLFNLCSLNKCCISYICCIAANFAGHVNNSWFATTWQGGHVGGQYNTILFRRICMKIEFSSQRRETVLFLTTNMAAVTSRANQQYSPKNLYTAFCLFICFTLTPGLFPSWINKNNLC